MGVMAAGMHHAGNLGSIGERGFLLHGQGVGIAAQAHRGPFLSAFQNGDGDIGRGGKIGDGPLIQERTDELMGPDFMMGDFGVPMQFSENMDEIILHMPGGRKNEFLGNAHVDSSDRKCCLPYSAMEGNILPVLSGFLRQETEKWIFSCVLLCYNKLP